MQIAGEQPTETKLEVKPDIHVHVHQTGIISGAVIGALTAVYLGLGPIGIGMCAVTGVLFRNWI
jgi:hypothetical protein